MTRVVYDNILIFRIESKVHRFSERAINGNTRVLFYYLLSNSHYRFEITVIYKKDVQKNTSNITTKIIGRLF